jgi:opacity protein-like surface antigen
VAPDIWAFGQVYAGLFSTSSTTEFGGSDIDYDENFMGGGINAGARYALSKRIGLDLSAEYTMMRGTASLDGDGIDDYTISISNIGLRTGVAVRF